MSDSVSLLEQIDGSQAEHEVTANNLFDAASAGAAYGRHAEACAGLTWGYYGTRYGGSAVANGTNACGASTTTYMVVNLSTGAVSFATSTTNWNDSAVYGRAYKIVTGTATVTSYEDHRFGPLGIFGAAGSASQLSALTDVAIATSPGPSDGDSLIYDAMIGKWVASPIASSVGRHAIPVLASSMQPSVVGGCGALASSVSGSNQPDIVYLSFDATTEEYAQFCVPMPKSWNAGTITFSPIWSHPSTATNFGVVWGLQAVALSNDDAMATSYGTAQTSTDTGGTTDDIYVGPESSAITVAGSPAAEDVVFFRLSRVTANGSDTMAVDARLMGVVLYITTNAGTDE